MDQWNGVFQAAGEHLGPYAPRALGALALLIGAWVVARIARGIVRRLFASARLDERLRSAGLGELLANIAYWLVWLLALPALLGALELEGLLAPVNSMMERLLGALPGLAGAAVIFGVGLLAARILRELATGILTAAGSERLAARIGLSAALGDRTLAGIAGSVLFILVLLPTLTAALQAMGLDVIARPVGRLLETVIDLLPKLVSAALIVAIGAILGRLIAGLVTALLAGLGINRLPAQLGMGEHFRVGGREPAELAGGVVMAAAVLLAVTQACELLGFSVLTDAVSRLGGVLAHLFVGLVILAIGLWVSTLAVRVVSERSIANARMLGHVVRSVILFFAAALALRQAGLPADIVTIAFASVFGSAGLAVAIAVGVGGRDVAARLLESAVASFGKKHDDGDASAG